eukprot:Polyplicarium_translucidae@DN449_c0_g1_i2.p1
MSGSEFGGEPNRTLSGEFDMTLENETTQQARERLRAQTGDRHAFPRLVALAALGDLVSELNGELPQLPTRRSVTFTPARDERTASRNSASQNSASQNSASQSPASQGSASQSQNSGHSPSGLRIMIRRSQTMPPVRDQPPQPRRPPPRA